MRQLPLMALTLLLACSSTGPSDVWQEQLDDARARWEQSGPSSYTFLYTRHCFCPQLSIRVTVHGGVVTSIRDTAVDTLYVAPMPDYAIPKLLDAIQDFIDRPVDQLTVSYDSMTGIPLTVAADPIANAVDDENGFSLTEFAPTP